MNGDVRLGFALDDFAGTKWKNLTGTALASPAGQRTSMCKQASLRPGNLASFFLGQQVGVFRPPCIQRIDAQPQRRRTARPTSSCEGFEL